MESLYIDLTYSSEGINFSKKNIIESTERINSSGLPAPNIELNDNSVSVKTDTFGCYPIYYYVNKCRIIISSSISSLVQEIPSPQINFAAVALFMQVGSFIGDSTAINDVKRLRGNQTIKIDKSGIKLSNWKPLWPNDGLYNFDSAQLVDSYIELMQESLKLLDCESTCEITLPLSGGRDSRHILLGFNALQMNQKLKVVTTEYELNNSTSRDADIAEKLCSELHIDCLRVGNKNNWIERERLKNRMTGYSTLLHAWYINLAKSVSPNSILVDGLAGDILSQSKRYSYRINQMFLDKNLQALSEYYSAPGYNLPKVLFKGFINERIAEEAKHYLFDELNLYTELHRPQSAFEFYNIAVKNNSLFSLHLAKESQVYFPYLHLPLFQFLSSVPFELFPDNDFHTQAIKKLNPYVAHIEYANGTDYTSFFSLIKASRFEKTNQFQCLRLLRNEHPDWLNIHSIGKSLIKGILSPFAQHSAQWLCSPTLFLTDLYGLVRR